MRFKSSLKGDCNKNRQIISDKEKFPIKHEILHELRKNLCLKSGPNIDCF